MLDETTAELLARLDAEIAILPISRKRMGVSQRVFEIVAAYPRLRAIIKEQEGSITELRHALRYETDAANEAIDDAQKAEAALAASQAREAALRAALETLIKGFPDFGLHPEDLVELLAAQPAPVAPEVRASGTWTRYEFGNRGGASASQPSMPTTEVRE